jgi:hypothetical protein
MMPGEAVIFMGPGDIGREIVLERGSFCKDNKLKLKANNIPSLWTDQ